MQDPAIVPAGPSNQGNYGAATDLAQKSWITPMWNSSMSTPRSWTSLGNHPGPNHCFAVHHQGGWVHGSQQLVRKYSVLQFFAGITRILLILFSKFWLFLNLVKYTSKTF
jgi:hypothetical protein